MKHLKIYEIYKSGITRRILDNIHKGDYVIMNHNSVFTTCISTYAIKELDEFLENNIGIVINVNKVNNNISVKYHDVPFTISGFFHNLGYEIFEPYDIVEYASTIDELKMKLQTNKYNL